METAAFVEMASHEDRHWWFVGRRAVLESLLAAIDIPESGTILEAGCGTGGNLATLARRGRVAAFEPHVDALRYARARFPSGDIRRGSLPENLPYPPASFDLVAALDVLEHVEDDEAAFDALVGLARPGGIILVTVPAHRALWGSHDRRLHHYRRYCRGDVERLIRRDDVDVVRVTPFNTLLSPLAVVYRLFEAGLHSSFGSQERLPPAALNATLARIFSWEARLIRTGKVLPFGLSYAAVLRRRSCA